MKEEGKTSKAPLTESFLRWGNLKIVLLALFGGVAGQAVVWYTGKFYALFFLLQTLKLDGPDREHARRRLAHPRHAVLHRLRLALRQDRPQEDHPGGLPHRRPDLLPDVQGAHQVREPCDLRGAGDEPGHGGRERRGLQLPVRSDRQAQVHELLRRREELARRRRSRTTTRSRPRARSRASRSAAPSSRASPAPSCRLPSSRRRWPSSTRRSATR